MRGSRKLYLPIVCTSKSSQYLTKSRFPLFFSCSLPDGFLGPTLRPAGPDLPRASGRAPVAPHLPGPPVRAPAAGFAHAFRLPRRDQVVGGRLVAPEAVRRPGLALRQVLAAAHRARVPQAISVQPPPHL